MRTSRKAIKKDIRCSCGEYAFNLKLGLCYPCYEMLSYNKRPKQGPNAREKEFIKNFFEHEEWTFEPVKLQLPGTSYTPDFYDRKNNVFIEMCGSRQAYACIRNKVLQAQELYPFLRIEFRQPSGRLIDTLSTTKVWEHDIVTDKPITKHTELLSMTDLSERTGISYHTIVSWINENLIPQEHIVMVASGRGTRTPKYLFSCIDWLERYYVRDRKYGRKAPEGFVGISEAADALGICMQTLRNRIKTGEIPSSAICRNQIHRRKIFIRKSAIEELNREV